MKKKTDGGHEIPEEDLREMEQDGGQEVPEGAKSVYRKPRTVSVNYLGIMQKGRLIRMLWK